MIVKRFLNYLPVVDLAPLGTRRGRHSLDLRTHHAAGGLRFSTANVGLPRIFSSHHFRDSISVRLWSTGTPFDGSRKGFGRSTT